MEVSLIKELSKYRYEKALSNFDTAKKLYEYEDYGVAQNRAYYAAFDAMRAVNALDGFDSSKHSGVISYFNQKFVKTNKFPSTTSSIIRKASTLREKSDYEDFYVPSKKETKEIIESIETFLKDIENYLIKQNVIKK